MIIQGPDYNGWTIEFNYSPFFEMMCSLHVLFKPEHHKGREQWARTTARVMQGTLYEGLRFFDAVTEGWMGPMEFLRLHGDFSDFDVIKSIRRLESLPLVTFVELMLNRAVAQADIRKILVLKKIHITGLNQEQIEFLLNPEEMKNEFISLLKSYFYLHFYMIQLEVEPFMIRTLHGHRALSCTMDFTAYVESLHPRIEADGDQFCLHKYKRFDFKYKDIKKISIGISTFIDPHLLLGTEEGFLSLTIRLNPEPVVSDVHEDLVQVLKALGDKTRLRLVKCLYARSCSTQELAQRIGITEAGISKHLKVLHEARLVGKIRKGNFMLYYLDKLMIDRIPMDTYQFLDET